MAAPTANTAQLPDGAPQVCRSNMLIATIGTNNINPAGNATNQTGNPRRHSENAITINATPANN